MATMKRQMDHGHKKGSEDSPPVDANKRPSYLEITLNQPGPSRFDERICRSLDSQFLDFDLEMEVQPIKTYLRLRPYSKKSENEIEVVEIKDEQTVVANSALPGFKANRAPKKTEYKFTKVLDANCSQQQVFEQAVEPLMDRFDRGENCLIFSYGATNSGKTYTMQGSTKKYGIIPRTLDLIFNRFQDKLYRGADIQPFMHESTRALNVEEQHVLLEKKTVLLAAAAKTNEIRNRPATAHANFSTVSEGSSHCGSVKYFTGMPVVGDYSSYEGTTLYSTWVSFVELYNEKCFDLLDNSEKGKGKRRVLKLMSQSDKNAYLKDLTELPVFNEEEAYAIYVAGYKKLQVGSTNANQCSSRSHCFFTIRVVELGVTKNGVFPIQTHRITFCDLAGMERVSQTENSGDQLRESANINQSLLSLLKVIRMIREKQMSFGPRQALADRIPFRESKLTRLFQGYFTDSTHIAMIVNVNPNPLMADSSIQTLQNSAIASNIIAFRPSSAPKVIVENSHNNSSFIHSSRDMEDIAEQTEEETYDVEETTSELKQSENTITQKKLGRSRRGVLGENNRQVSSRTTILSPPYTEDAESDKENEMNCETVVSNKYAVTIANLRNEMNQERERYTQEIKVRDKEIRRLNLKVRTIEQETRESMAQYFQEGLAKSTEITMGHLEIKEKALHLSEKRCQEYQSRLGSVQPSTISSTSTSTQTECKKTKSIAMQTDDSMFI